jgi:excisionase family DNA binding protein
MNKTSPYLRPSEAAQYARVGKTTIKRWLEQGAVKGYKVKGVRLLKIADIDAMIEGGASK